MHIGLPKELGTLQYFTILAIQGHGEKMPQPSVDNRLNFFSLFFWQADLNTNIEDESRSFYGVSSQYESPENMVITCSTKVCSFGKQVVEKVEVRSRHTWVQGSLSLLFCHFKYFHPAFVSQGKIYLMLLVREMDAIDYYL